MGCLSLSCQCTKGVRPDTFVQYSWFKRGAVPVRSVDYGTLPIYPLFQISNMGSLSRGYLVY
jgi:hypothetical protein